MVEVATETIATIVDLLNLDPSKSQALQLKLTITQAFDCNFWTECHTQMQRYFGQHRYVRRLVPCMP